MAAKKQVVEAFRRYVPCCFSGCPHDAILRVKTRSGWAVVCPEHDEALVRKDAEETCKALGLDTVEKRRQYVRDLLKGMRRKFTPPYANEDREIAI